MNRCIIPSHDLSGTASPDCRPKTTPQSSTPCLAVSRQSVMAVVDHSVDHSRSEAQFEHTILITEPASY